MAEIYTYQDSKELAEAAADVFVASAGQTIEEHGVFRVALSGGSTPQQLYETLAADHHAPQVNWDKVQVFWGDERTVPPDHADSNYKMAREALLDHVPIPVENVHRMRGENQPEEAAQAYEAMLREQFPDETVPAFDLIFLGMGDDGHTASLFPGTSALNATDRLVVANYIEKLSTWRLTFTPTLLNASKRIVFLVAGEDKAERLHHVLEGPLQPAQFPAQAIRPENGMMIWMIDQAAGARLHV